MALPAQFWGGMRMFDDQIQSSYALLETYESNVMNANSGGAIIFGSGTQNSTIGESAQWDRSTVSTTHFRNPEVQTDVTPDYMRQYVTKTVKLASRWGPTVLDTSTAMWKGIPVDRLGYVRGAQVAARSVNFRAEVAISALKGVFGLAAFAPVKKDIAISPAGTLPVATAANKPSIKFLAEGQAMMGASWGLLQVWLMHSAVFHGIVGDNITNSNRLFSIGTVDVYEFMGKRFLVTDNPQLIKPAETRAAQKHPAEYYTFGLMPGAVSVLSAGEFDSTSEKPTGKDNIQITVQEQDSTIVGVRNMSYNKTTPPSSLTDLSTAANWTADIATWDKIDYCGVQLISNA